MPIHKIIPGKNRHTCSISDDGTLNIPQAIMEKLNWQRGVRIAIDYLVTPLVLGFRIARGEPNSFQLNYLNRKGNTTTGGKVGSLPFTRDVLRRRVTLPMSGIVPIYLTQRYTMAWILDEPTWTEDDFSKQAALNLARDAVGVYQLLDADQVIVKIGEGSLWSRIDEHLRLGKYPKAVIMQYMIMTDKEETAFLEKLLLARFEQDNGKPPEYNLIRR